jgi:hypothetical protein
MTCISPICKKLKNFISALKSPTYRDFMIKKSLKSKTSKSHTWAPLSIFTGPFLSPAAQKLATWQVATVMRLRGLLKSSRKHFYSLLHSASTPVFFSRASLTYLTALLFSSKKPLKTVL